MGKRRKLVGLPVVSLSEVKGTGGYHASGPVARKSEGASVTEFQPKEREASVVSEPSRRPWLAERKDTPVCNFTRKARRPEQPTWTPQVREEALSQLRRDYVAMSSKGPAASLLRTWEGMHRRMFDSHIPTFPLTAGKIASVAAAFKMCGYRSFSNYASKAKEIHIQMYGEWPADLAMEVRRATRSVTRGIGPVMQRLPLDIEKILQHQTGHQVSHLPVVSEGPVGAHNLMVIGTFFMLREVEASLLLAANVRTDSVNQVVTIRLPCTKTDPAAASVERSWGCLCSVHGAVGCPYHSAELQWKFLTKLFGDLRLIEDLPFFPSLRGTTVEKIKVVDSFEHVHAALGLPVRDEDGHRLLGGHSMRLAGARVLSSSGMHLYQIELMARWRSQMLIHYAQTAPLCKITQAYEQSRTGTNLPETLDQVRQQMSQLQNTTRPGFDAHQFEDRVAALERVIQTLDGCTKAMIQTEIQRVKRDFLNAPSEFVMNRASKTWHVVDIDGMAHPPEQWSTKCGWKFANAKFIRSIDAPTEQCKKCDKCWNNTESDTSSTESSTESED
eukprot:s3225_g8.t1